MKSKKPIAPRPSVGKQIEATTGTRGFSRIFAALFGLFLGLTLVKFGNPAMVDTWSNLSQTFLPQADGVQAVSGRMIEWPANGYEWVLNAWPVTIGYWMLIGLVGFGIFNANWKIKCPRWLILMPLLWLIWQFVSSSHTVDTRITTATLKHFVACVACFYLGLCCLNVRNLAGFWVGLLVGFTWVLVSGLFQHFGGLEETSKRFWLYVYPALDHPSPELLKKMSSRRIFSTLFYPNALAGAVLLFTPILLSFLWHLERQFTKGARVLLVALIGLSALGCLFWSGSKGGWLLTLIIGFVVLLRLKFERKLKIALIALILVGGLTAFSLRFAGYFQKGATSVSARFDYWQAALKTTASNPILGTGPGTFAIPYRQIKRPDAEMARLTHNDFLQQASDSGILGFFSYVLTVWGTLIWAAREAFGRGGIFFSIWLGLFGWALQGFMEFGLYIPALAWPAFAFMGWLLAALGNQFDKTKTSPYAPTP